MSADAYSEQEPPEEKVASIEELSQQVPPPEVSGVNEQVLLVVPARPEMWAVVRMTASSLATHLDFSFEDIEDLRLAVTELCGSCAVGAASDAKCECHFDISEDEFSMHCHVSSVNESAPLQVEHRFMSTLELSKQILQATVDTYEIDSVKDGMRHGHLCKARGPVTLN